MPTVVNGIGTWYYGRRNITARVAPCEFCGAAGRLISYDTTRFFVVVFIPFIPLGARRIIDECPACRKHRAASLREWERTRTQRIGDAGLRWKEKPDDPERAIELIVAAAGFQGREELGGIGASLPPSLMNNPKVLAALAGGYEHLGMHTEAEEAYRALHAADPRPETEHDLAVYLLKAGKPHDALPMVESLLARATPDDRGLLFLATESLRAVGANDQALDLLTRHTSRFPGMESEKEFKRYLKRARKAAGTSRKAKSTMFPVGSAASEPPRGGVGFRFARWVPVAAILLILAGFSMSSYSKSQSRTIFLVNGLHRPYEVFIAGKRAMLPPRAHVKVRVAEGYLSVRTADRSLGIADQTVPVKSSFFLRPFDSRTFIINPDRTAILAWERTKYSAAAGGAPPPEWRLHAGLASYTLKGIDHAFEPFPATITSSRKSGTVTRERVSQLNLPLVQEIQALAGSLGMEAAREHARLAFLAEPDRADGMDAFLSLTEPARAQELVRPLLARRPILVHAHRAYQFTVEALHPDADLEAEYQTLLDAEPGNPVLKYLLARVCADRTRGIALFEEAGQARLPIALRALAFEYMAQGRFDLALDAAARGRDLDPTDSALPRFHHLSLAALRRFDECLALPQFGRPTSSLDMIDLEDKAALLTAAGKVREASAFAQSLASGPEANVPLRDHLQAVVEYCAGNAARFAELEAASAWPRSRFEAAVVAGKLAEAEQILDTPDAGGSRLMGSESNLLLALAAHRAGDRGLSERRLAHAVKALAQTDRAGRTLSSWLATTEAPPAGRITSLPITTDLKLLALPLLADRFPERRDECLSLARALNFDPRFPHQLVAAAIDAD